MSKVYEFTPSLTVESNVKIVRMRELPIKGEILVKVGDNVSNEDIIARTSLQGDLILLRIAKELGLETTDIENSFLVNVGDRIKDGDVIVSRKGLFGFFNSEYISKYNGTVEFISKETGTLGIRLKPKEFNLKSYIAGKVIKCDESQFVVIESFGAMIQGVFGVGGEKIGILKSLDKKDKDTFLYEKDTAIFYNDTPDISILKEACEANVTAFICPSISSKTLKEFLGYDIGVAITGDENIGMTIIITEGFGKLFFNPRTYLILKQNEGKKVSVNGATQIRAGAERPEVLIFNKNHNETLEEPIQENKSLAIGNSVRILRDPYFGEIGTIEEILKDNNKFESGVICRGLKIKTKKYGDVIVPKANVELV